LGTEQMISQGLPHALYHQPPKSISFEKSQRLLSTTVYTDSCYGLHYLFEPNLPNDITGYFLYVYILFA
jgi:hypothetical protein